MTLGGTAVVLTTVGIAAMNGAATALVGAGMIGFSAYVTSRRILNQLPERVLRTQTDILELAVRHEMQKQAKSPDGIDENKIKAMQKEAKAQVEQLEATCNDQRWGNREMAAVIGVASFAYPPLGVVAVLGNVALELGLFDHAKPRGQRVDWAQALNEVTAVA